MPTKKRIPEEPPSEELVLAAIDRASRHRRRQENPGVLFATVKEHLGLAHGGWSTRRLRPVWDGLQAAGLIEQSRRHGSTLWGLTRTGAQRLKAAQQSGELEPLPESPQHRFWREARVAASDRINEFRGDLRSALDEATDLLDASDDARSDAWYEFSERLQVACRRLGSATYCLHEWLEPDDAEADIAPAGLGGRRQIWRR